MVVVLVCHIRCRARDFFVADLARAVLIAAVSWPLALLAGAVFFMAVATVAEALGVPHAFINPVIFYGIFYFPAVVSLMLFLSYQARRVADVDHIDAVKSDATTVVIVTAS